jgi:acyl-CoA thioesterase-1
MTVSATPLRIIAFGDSLSAGYMLPADSSFPAVLQKKLRDEGFDVEIINAGVSGDTTTGGLQRLDWSLGEGADGVILELGANDMLRGLDPKITEAALGEMIAKLQARNIKVLLVGMQATPSLGAPYKTSFDAIYPALATKYAVPLYPFFLDGVTGNATLALADGMHPNRAGVERMVDGILPSVKAFLKTITKS